MDAAQHCYRSPMSFPLRWRAEERELTVTGDREIESVATFFGHRVADGFGGFFVQETPRMNRGGNSIA